MEKKPFHEVILKRMRAAAEFVSGSAGYEDRLMDYGEVLRESIIPESERTNVTNFLRGLAENFPNASDDTVPAQHFLKALAKDIEQDV